MKKFKDLQKGDIIYYYPKSTEEPIQEYILLGFRYKPLDPEKVDLIVEGKDRLNKHLESYLHLTKNQLRHMYIVWDEFGFYREKEWIKRLEI